LAHLRINVIPSRVAGKVQASIKGSSGSRSLLVYEDIYANSDLLNHLRRAGIFQMTGGPGISISADVIEEVHWRTCYEPMGS
jgi:hypothetical protein